jgi:hypothetical protein
VDPTQIEQTVDLPHQMIQWNHIIQIKRNKRTDPERSPADPSCAAPADDP